MLFRNATWKSKAIFLINFNLLIESYRDLGMTNLSVVNSSSPRSCFVLQSTEAEIMSQRQSTSLRNPRKIGVAAVSDSMMGHNGANWSYSLSASWRLQAWNCAKYFTSGCQYSSCLTLNFQISSYFVEGAEQHYQPMYCSDAFSASITQQQSLCSLFKESVNGHVLLKPK